MSILSKSRFYPNVCRLYWVVSQYYQDICRFYRVTSQIYKAIGWGYWDVSQYCHHKNVLHCVIRQFRLDVIQLYRDMLDCSVL